MGKNNKRKNRGKASGGGDSSAAVWDGADHVMRKEKQLEKKSKKLDQVTTSEKEQNRVERRFQRTAKLTHDSQEKREETKLRLNITKTQRDIEKLRKRLQKWDDVEEKILLEKQKEEERKALEEPPKKRGRLGPESWKLKGAARPAWEVCEFDVRYQCPHQKAHEEAHAKARRERNLLAIYNGKFGQINQDELSYPHRRQFLALLMQWGLLCMESKKYKTARIAFLECLGLDGVTEPITSARCYLMRLYLQVNRPQSVHQLWNTKLSSEHEKSPWVLFSVALVEYIRWKEFQESNRLAAEKILAQAIKGNVLCAYYLAFSDFFHKHMEYTDEVEDIDEEEKGPLEEAIEYCSSEQMGMWIGTDGAIEWVKNTILRVLHGQQVANGALRLVDVEWSAALHEIEEEEKAKKAAVVSLSENDDDEEDNVYEKDNDEPEGGEDGDSEPPHGADDDNSQDDDSEEEDSRAEVDTMMYIGMYRTTMEMLYETGALSTPPLVIEEDDEEMIESEMKEKDAEGVSAAEEKSSEKNADKPDSDSDDSST